MPHKSSQPGGRPTRRSSPSQAGGRPTRRSSPSLRLERRQSGACTWTWCWMRS